MKVRYTPRARSDLNEIFAHIAKDNLDAAQRMRRSMIAAIELIGARPFIGIRNARAPELWSRLMSRYPYRVHYLIRDDEVWIVHIRHTARRPWREDR